MCALFNFNIFSKLGKNLTSLTVYIFISCLLTKYAVSQLSFINSVFFFLNFCRAKPRMSAVAGRRTYTEEELQNALQDILSGKLGTRRAAVLYGIPRSTLRNKVYKLAMEEKREASLLPQPHVLDALDPDDEEKELSGGEDDKELDKSLNRIMLTQEEMPHLTSPRSTVNLAATQKYGQIFENTFKEQHQSQQHKSQATTPSTPPISTNNWLDPLMIQNLLFAGGLMQQKFDDPAFQELLRNLLLQQQELIKEQLKNSVTSTPTDHLNNGKPVDTRNLMHNVSMLQSQNQQIQNRQIKSETPDPVQTVDLNDSEDSAVILKIPSYKPVAGSSSSSGKNGDNANDSTPQTTPPLHSRSPQTNLASAGFSPPIMRQNNDSQSPPIGPMSGKSMLSLRDVIAKSLTRTFTQQSPETMNKPSMDHLEQYKRPSISVIKNLGGPDMNRFPTSPNLMASMHSNNSNSPSNLNNSGGKGTRPKRGKYRNYDRDSLVEAVKAVQRGEMSVHRAGSYYGVPHSTLEYKVKERHLMRPRKREPKPQPLDGSGGSTSTTTGHKSHDISVSAGSNMRPLDKTAKSLPTTKPSMKTPPFPATSPNGLKMGLFDPSQLQYPPHLFWPHPPGYTGLPMDFAQRSSSTSATFPANAESFFASQMIQRFQEDALRQSNASNLTSSKAGSSMTTTASDIAAVASSASKNKQNISGKMEREMTLENLYDGTSANGSFLDGIIRNRLAGKTGDSIPHGALLDQLVKNNRHSISDGDGSNSNNKRSGSPFNFAHHGIKRERTSSSSGDTDPDSVERDLPSKESVAALLKYREGLSLRMDVKSRKSSTDELNGISPDSKMQRHIETEDSS